MGGLEYAMHACVDVDTQVHAYECICMHTHAGHAYSTRWGSPKSVAHPGLGPRKLRAGAYIQGVHTLHT